MARAGRRSDLYSHLRISTDRSVGHMSKTDMFAFALNFTAVHTSRWCYISGGGALTSGTSMWGDVGATPQ